MALTSAQRVQVRMYLGWSERFHQTDSRLEQALNALDADVDGLAQILVLLAQVQAIDVNITNCYQRFQVIKVGSIELPGKLELGLLRSEGRRIVGRMAALMGVAVRHDVFSGTGPRSFGSTRGLISDDDSGSGGGGFPPMG